MAGEKVTEQQLIECETDKQSGVILNERFVHRDVILDPVNLFFLEDPDALIARLAEHFVLNQKELFHLPAMTSDAGQMIDDMPRFQQSQRDGLQVPKEGQDGTGN